MTVIQCINSTGWAIPPFIIFNTRKEEASVSACSPASSASLSYSIFGNFLAMRNNRRFSIRDRTSGRPLRGSDSNWWCFYQRVMSTPATTIFFTCMESTPTQTSLYPIFNSWYHLTPNVVRQDCTWSWKRHLHLRLMKEEGMLWFYPTPLEINWDMGILRWALEIQLDWRLCIDWLISWLETYVLSSHMIICRMISIGDCQGRYYRLGIM